MTKPKIDDAQSSGIPPGLILIAITCFIGFATAIALVFAEGRMTTTQQGRIVEQRSIGSLMNLPAPNFELPDLEGNSVSLEDLRGRVVFLNFWATWCVPCRREMPAFEDFMAQQDADGPLVLTINDGESADQVRDFFDEIDVEGIPTLLDSDSRLRSAYAVAALPTTFVIDGEGVIRAVKFGEIFLEDFDSYLAQLAANQG